MGGVSADYGLLSTYQITDMFKGTTATRRPSTTNLRRLRVPSTRGRSNAEPPTQTTRPCRHWGQFQLGIPEPGMLGTTKTHVAATELRRSCLAVDVASR